MRLEGKIAIITGGASGIGLATAEAFAREGASVAIADLNGAGAEQAATALPGEGHLGFACDVTDSTRVTQVVHNVVERHGRVDVLMNNAGVDKLPGDGFEQAIERREPPILHITDEAISKMLSIHVSGAMYFARAAVPSMIEQRGGAIINVASIAGLAGMGAPAYAAAKGALLGLTKSLARELGPYGIRSNAISPGVIATPMTEAVPDAFLEPMVKATPLRRKGEARDIAETAVYLASEDSAFVTGQQISPNGGIVIA
jgi:NAD(P)-dependent dehydrogenase (short-subunit alcohol dehydrogenase family)